MSGAMIDNFRAQPETRKRRLTEQELREEESSTAWAFVWVLFAFKIATLLATFWAAAGSMDAAIILMGTNWIFIVIPMFAIWGPILFHYRLRRVRRRRAAMVRSEWILD